MIKNFEEVKSQLAELSEVVNKFKSEAVQLRIVELVFSGATLPDGDNTAHHATRKGSKNKRAAVTDSAEGKGDSKRKRSAGSTGPKTTLEQFIGEGFFNEKRTIGAVVEHCKIKARNFKSNELSGPLGRLVRENQLSRTTSAENQYEYIKK
jgi:hypothetical protein